MRSTSPVLVSKWSQACFPGVFYALTIAPFARGRAELFAALTVQVIESLSLTAASPVLIVGSIMKVQLEYKGKHLLTVIPWPNTRAMKGVTMLKVTRNTYPVHPGVAHAKPGDEVFWEFHKGCYRLLRKQDGKVLFATAPCDKDGLLRSNGQPPKLVGVVAEIKSKGWILEIEKE